MPCLKTFSYYLQVFVCNVVVLLVTFIMPLIYPLLLQGWWFPLCVFIRVAEWQLMYITELISTGDGQIMETLDSIEIKLFVLYSASVGALQIVFSNILYESTAKWRLSFQRWHCWCTFSWSIWNQNSRFIRRIHSSSFQGYYDIHIMRRRYQLRGVSGRKPKLSEWDRCTLKRIVFIN